MMKILKIVFIVIWICAIISVVCIRNSISTKDSADKAAIGKRSKRYTKLYSWVPFNTAIALAVVLAIPLQLKGRNIYMSYNFETNFYMPYFDNKQGLVPLPFATIYAPAVNSGTKPFYDSEGQVRNLDDNNIENNRNSTVSESDTFTEKYIHIEKEFLKISTKVPTKKSKQSKRTKRKSKKTRVNREILQTLLSRKKLYKIVEHKLEMAGLNGVECLLKAICETIESPINFNNGVLGDIWHIIFTPTTSRDEKLPQRYYDAVTDGQSGRCRYYNTLCPTGIFDFITKTL